jgi:hypothetical protein
MPINMKPHPSMKNHTAEYRVRPCCLQTITTHKSDEGNGDSETSCICAEIKSGSQNKLRDYLE